MTDDTPDGLPATTTLPTEVVTTLIRASEAYLDERGTPEAYRAVGVAKANLGYDDPSPNREWPDAWGVEPDFVDVDPDDRPSLDGVSSTFRVDRSTFESMVEADDDGQPSIREVMEEGTSYVCPGCLHVVTPETTIHLTEEVDEINLSHPGCGWEQKYEPGEPDTTVGDSDD